MPSFEMAYAFTFMSGKTIFDISMFLIEHDKFEFNFRFHSLVKD